MAFTVEELAREEGLSTALSMENGGGSCTYLLHGGNPEINFPDLLDMRKWANEIVGGPTNVHVQICDYSQSGDAGKIVRKLPKVHPFFELPVAGITSLSGHGHQKEETPKTPLAYGPAAKSYITPKFTHYSAYKATVQFSKRSYFLKHNGMITRRKLEYFEPDTFLGKTMIVADEWKRFLWRTSVPLGDTAETEFGQMKFRSGGARIVNNNFLGKPFVHLQNEKVEMMWYQVPYRYLFDHTIDGVFYPSYLKQFVNRVNQYDFYDYPRGTLLYLGATPQPYVPMVPDILRLPKGFGGIPLATSECLVCNVSLAFIYTGRRTTDVIEGDYLDVDKNIIPAGHNLQPNFVDRRFHMVTTEDPRFPLEQPFWKPCFLSVPFEILFTDPLLRQPNGPFA